MGWGGVGWGEVRRGRDSTLRQVVRARRLTADSLYSRASREVTKLVTTRKATTQSCRKEAEHVGV